MGAAMVADGEPHARPAIFRPGPAARRDRCDASAPTAASLTICSAATRMPRSDYRAALSGTDGDEARRRLALSLAITGDKAGALAMLGAVDGARRCRRGALPGAGAGADRRPRRRPPRRSSGDARVVGHRWRRSSPSCRRCARTRRRPRSTSASSPIGPAERTPTCRGPAPARRAACRHDRPRLARRTGRLKLQRHRRRCRCRGDRLASIDAAAAAPAQRATAPTVVAGADREPCRRRPASTRSGVSTTGRACGCSWPAARNAERACRTSSAGSSPSTPTVRRDQRLCRRRRRPGAAADRAVQERSDAEYYRRRP